MSCNCKEGECLHPESGQCPVYPLHHAPHGQMQQAPQHVVLGTQQQGGAQLAIQQIFIPTSNNPPFDGETFGDDEWVLCG